MDDNTTKGFKLSEDNLSKLPDDIVCFTLSLLPLREATKTSILSHRWRYMWKGSLKYSRGINLDVLDMRSMIACHYATRVNNKRLYYAERRKFLEWMEQMLHVDYGSVIDSFRLRFYLKADSSQIIDQWLRIAMAKEVEKIDMDLSHFCRMGPEFPVENLYTFPCSHFTKRQWSSVKRLCLRSCIFEPLDLEYYSSLVEVDLGLVLLNQDNICKFLSNSPSLEKVRLYKCWNLLNLTISGSSKLKYLSVSNCSKLVEININARNLTKFEFIGLQVKLFFQNVPRLSDVTIIPTLGNFSGAFRYALGKLSCDVPKLESLYLTVTDLQGNKMAPELPLFSYLKELVLRVGGVEQVLWDFIHLVHASPFLRRLEVQLYESAKECEAVRQPSNSPHLHLKEIMLTDFLGTCHEIEFARYLIENSINLEKITIQYEVDPPDFQKECSLKIYDSDEEVEPYPEEVFQMQQMQERTSVQLANSLRSGVQLLFI